MASQARQPEARRPNSIGGRVFMVVVYAVQFFFGGWFLWNGLNYFFGFFPQPPGSSPISQELIGALIHSGLFGVVKAIEGVVGLMLLANRFVPLAIALSLPVSVCIAHLNIIANGDTFGIIAGAIVLGLNVIIALGHVDKFLPLLVFDQGDPSPAGLFALFGPRK